MGPRVKQRGGPVETRMLTSTFSGAAPRTESGRRDHAAIKARDALDIAMFGKAQKFKRNFGMTSIVGLCCTMMITWEGVLISFGEGFSNGGPQGLICSYIFAWVGVTAQTLVMAEMGSMIPLAGGQYNWVAVLAPKSCRKFLSYLTGWITVIGWQATTAAVVYLVGSMLQGMIIIEHPEYDPTEWQAVLLFYAVIVLSLFVNTVLARFLPQLESAILIIHILGFFGLLIPLVYLGPHGSASDVFQRFVNQGGWSTNSIAYFVGSTTQMFAFIGIDGATHMAEEIENAVSVIPQSMVMTIVINGSLGFAILLAALFCLGDLQAALDTKTGFPFMEIFLQAVQSVPGAYAMISVLLVALFFAAFGVLATGSRMLWAFARERAMPGHSFISRVHRGTALPLWAIATSTMVNLVLALINLGSNAVFGAFTGLTVAAFYSSFAISAGVMLYRILTDGDKGLNWGPFTLPHRLRVPIYVFSIGYSIIGWFFSFWPQKPNPSLEDMNWEVVVYCGVIFLALVYWVLVARKTYTGPVIEVTVDGDEIKPATADDGGIARKMDPT